MGHQKALLYDATLRARAVRDAGGQPLTVGARLNFEDLGEYVVFRVDQDGEETQYHAVKSACWDDTRQAFRFDMQLYAKDAVAHLWDPDPNDPRGRPEPPVSPRLQATFKWEQTDEDGEDVGPLIVFSPEEDDVVWESPEWMRLSEAEALADRKEWQFTRDGSSDCGDDELDEELQKAILQGDATEAALMTEEGMRHYFSVAPDEDLPDVARRILDAFEQQTRGLQSE
jgi:hypothetical protein